MTLPATRESRDLSTSISIPTVSVVIPTLNEAENLRLLLPVIPDWIHEIIVVDGRSTDHTIEVVESFAQQRRLDADCSMHPCEILLLVAALTAGADFAKGSRFIQGGGTADMSWFRALGNWGLTQIVNVLYRGSFTDLCYGYFAFWRRCLPVIDPTCDGFEVETFIKLQAMKARLRIAEVPSFETLRIHGMSNLHAVPDGIRVLRTILQERYAAARVVEGAFRTKDLQSFRSFLPSVAAMPVVSPIISSMAVSAGTAASGESALPGYPD
jgi:glycosyltransferase involved in cell wall biosynthesis